MLPPPPTSTLFPYTPLFRSPGLDPAEHLGEPPHRAPRPGARHLHVSLAKSEEHTSELQSRRDLVCRLLLEKKKTNNSQMQSHVNIRFYLRQYLIHLSPTPSC